MQVRSEWQLLNLIRYVESNPVAAGRVEHASLWTSASAAWHRRGILPIWMDREWWSQQLRVAVGDREAWREAFEKRFGEALSAEERVLMEKRIEAALRARGAEHDLLGAEAEQLEEFFSDRADRLDGRNRALPFLLPGRLDESLRELRAELGDWDEPGRGPRIDNWRLCRTGLLIEGCGWTHAELALERGVSRQSISEAHRKFRVALRRSEFRGRVIQLVERAK